MAASSTVRPTKLTGNGAPEVPIVARTTPRSGTVWTIRDGRGTRHFVPKAIMHLSTLPMMRNAVLAGAAAALLPRSLVGHDLAAGRLACWGTQDGPSMELWALHTSRRLASAKVKAFIGYLATTLADDAGSRLLDR